MNEGFTKACPQRVKLRALDREGNACSQMAKAIHLSRERTNSPCHEFQAAIDPFPIFAG